jgi:hypothetical protein
MKSFKVEKRVTLNDIKIVMLFNSFEAMIVKVPHNSNTIEATIQFYLPKEIGGGREFYIKSLLEEGSFLTKTNHELYQLYKQMMKEWYNQYPHLKEKMKSYHEAKAAKWS